MGFNKVKKHVNVSTQKKPNGLSFKINLNLGAKKEPAPMIMGGGGRGLPPQQMMPMPGANGAGIPPQHKKPSYPMPGANGSGLPPAPKPIKKPGFFSRMGSKIAGFGKKVASKTGNWFSNVGSKVKAFGKGVVNVGKKIAKKITNVAKSIKKLLTFNNGGKKVKVETYSDEQI